MRLSKGLHAIQANPHTAESGAQMATYLKRDRLLNESGHLTAGL